MRRRTKRIVRTASAGALLAGTIGIASTGAHAGAVDDAEFDFTGAAQEFVVPADVCSLTVEVVGAGGNEEGDINPEALGIRPLGKGAAVAAGGLGGLAVAEIEVTPGETLHVVVGGQGGIDSYPDAGGFNGGGDGGDPGEDWGGGGGGGTDVRRAPYALEDRLVVAGGGGGGGGDSSEEATGGDGGGLEGTDGGESQSDPVTPAGEGGTQTAGGLAPTAFDATAENGALGVGGAGGNGENDNDGGGGGGGGYFGGGGGAGDDESSDDGAGGGGGSGFGPAGTTFETGVNAAEGAATIEWVVDPGCGDVPTTTTTTAAAAAAAVVPRFTG